MLVARSKADIICLAVYTLTGGRLLQCRMLMTVAQRLGIPFDEAHQMAEAAAKSGLVEVAHDGSVSLTVKGQRRGAMLTPPAG